jgi:plasmid stabilization system protein ParE
MTEPLRVLFEPRAAEEAETVARWWRTHRDAAELFETELLQALELVRTMPSLGTPAPDESLAGVRRVLLRRTRYHVYYRVIGDELRVLAIWHAVRPPPAL